MKNCSLWEGATMENFVQECVPCVGFHAGAGKECEEEGASEAACDDLTATLFLVPLGGLVGRRWRICEWS